jgi:hypothetical protein
MENITEGMGNLRKAAYLGEMWRKNLGEEVKDIVLWRQKIIME